MTRMLALATIALMGLGAACQKRQDQAQTTDSTARNLTLAPADSSATMRDVPENRPPAAPPTATTPRTRTPAQRNPNNPNRPTPPAPPTQPAHALARFSPGPRFAVAATDTIPPRPATGKNPLTARRVTDVK